MADSTQRLWDFCRAFCPGGKAKADQDRGGKLMQFLREANGGD
jgi:hypothetical protein